MLWESVLTEGLSQEEVDKIIPAEELNHVLAIRLDELKQIYTVKFQNKKTGQVNMLCVWGEENDLYTHEFVTLETLIKTTTNMCTRDNLYLNISFKCTEQSPWRASITQMYPKLWNPDSVEEKEDMEKLTGFSYETIPSAYFADWWIANELWHKEIYCVGNTFIGLQLQILYLLSKLSYSTFPPMITRRSLV